MIMIHIGYVNTAYFSFIIWNCASAFIRMFFIQKIFPHNTGTSSRITALLDSIYSIGLTCRNHCSGLIVQFSLPPSSYFTRPWGLPLTLLSALPSFHSANSLHLPSLGSQASQPSPALCISMYVCVCVYLSLRAHSLVPAHVSYFEISYLAPCLFLPVSWPSRFLPFVGCCMPSLYLRHMCNYT